MNEHLFRYLGDLCHGAPLNFSRPLSSVNSIMEALLIVAIIIIVVFIVMFVVARSPHTHPMR